MATHPAPIKVPCHLRPISDVLAEQGVTRIDVLKVDVEGAELDVLLGLSENHWRQLQCLVTEVHDNQGNVEPIKALLNKYGLTDLSITKEVLTEAANMYKVVAKRPCPHTL